MSGDGKRSDAEWPKLPRPSSTLPLSPEQMSYLKGMTGFCLAVEPTFITRMRRKYGNEPIDRVLAFAPLPKRLFSAP